MARMPKVNAVMGIGADEVRLLCSDYLGYGPERYAPEVPQRVVRLPAFDIDVFPVTNAEYALAVGAGVVAEPVLWSRVKSFDGSSPVVGVSYYEAMRYAEWLGKRLPTNEEWELAATWDPWESRKLRYPWGDAWDPERCLNAEWILGRRISGCADWQASFWNAQVWLEKGRVEPVGQREGDSSPIGCRMMAGHVWEWVESRHQDQSAAAATGMLKGGSWVDDRNSCRGTYSVLSPRSAWLYGPSDVGFRCARSAE